jgi:peroxiredoxin
MRSLVFITQMALLAIISGCMPQLKDQAESNFQVEPSSFPTRFFNAEGEQVQLSDYRGKSVVLVVVRGMPESPGGKFCAYCLAQANGISKNYHEFQARQAEVVLVVPGPREVAEAFLHQVSGSQSLSAAVPYPLVVDEDAVAVNQLGIRGDLAKPSTFILNPDGKIVYAYVGKSTSDRPSIKAVLAELDRLNIVVH